MNLRDALGIGDDRDDVIDMAARFFTMAVEQNFTKWRRTELLLSSCLYLTCREKNIPFLLIDFSSYLRVSVYELGSVYLQLCELLYIAENRNYEKLVDPSIFIPRFSNSLLKGKHDKAVVKTARDIIASMKRDWIQTGRKPSGICGAALYTAALSHGIKCSKTDIVKIVHICEATLTKRLIEFGNTEAASLNVDELTERERVLHERSFTTKPNSDKEEVLCMHKDCKSFNYGLCESCCNDFISISGGLVGGSDPPAFQRAEKERMEKAAREENEGGIEKRERERERRGERMGEVADNSNTLTKKKKKKGRPSLLDLQKRALKQQQLLHEQDLRSTNPNCAGRSNLIRRNSNVDQASDDDDERRDKKHRLLHGLNSHDRVDSSDFKSGGCDLDADSISRRNIDGAVHGSDYTEEKASKATDIPQRRFLVDSGPSTPLPDKKLLLFILDRVQKKDTYGVYSDPVDPEELPDYHEIIKNPMDFTTLRKKLESGAYANLEQFEKDMFLICTNAMEYNSADTIYFRQARAMLELAKKDFENLRQESDGEESMSLSQQQQPKVVKRGRPPGTGLKKQPEQSSIDRTTSEILADVAGDNSRLSGSYNLRKNPPSYGFRQAETSVRINHNSEYQTGVLIDWEKEFPRSVVKAVNKYGMKNVDENKRDTYNQISSSLQEASVFTMLEDDLKQLTPVGLKAEYGYARSLARYAANLGPVAWRLANKRIETVLPTGPEFGPGWVGENHENPPQQQILASDGHHHSSRIMSPKTSVSSSIIGNKHSSHGSKEESAPAARVLKQETESNGLVHGYGGLNEKQNQMVETALSQPQQGLFPNRKQEFHRLPPDLNARLASPNSPGSNHQAGAAGSSQHPDLALQL